MDGGECVCVDDEAIVGESHSLVTQVDLRLPFVEMVGSQEEVDVPWDFSYIGWDEVDLGGPLVAHWDHHSLFYSVVSDPLDFPFQVWKFLALFFSVLRTFKFSMLLQKDASRTLN